MTDEMNESNKNESLRVYGHFFTICLSISLRFREREGERVEGRGGASSMGTLPPSLPLPSRHRVGHLSVNYG